MIKDENVVKPIEPSKEDLLVVHTKKYLKSLKCSINVATIVEVLPLCLVPNYFDIRAGTCRRREDLEKIRREYTKKFKDYITWNYKNIT